MNNHYGFTPLRPESAARLSHDDSDAAGLPLVLGVCLAALMIGFALVWLLAWVATHLQIGPFLVSFIVASICMRTFR